ncbi:XkdX family protein [Cohnella caldifontis]|nr:XkdX family protein [Cohnella sp. YIM B05605]
MSDFERVQYYYQKGWAKLPQLLQYVRFGVITTEHYNEITGLDYEGLA